MHESYQRHLVKKGQWIFNQRCVACHGKRGEGVVGPNLTDWYFLHGSSRKDMLKSIRYGIEQRGMPAWDKTLSKGELSAITSYVWSLRGKEEQGRQGEGTLIKKELR